MALSSADAKKSNLTPQELICVLYMILLDEPGRQIRFKAIELADLTAGPRLRLYCEYFHTSKVFRISIQTDPFKGKSLALPPSGALALMHYKKLTERQVLEPREMITCLYLALLRRPQRRFQWSLADFEALKKRGELAMAATYYPAEKVFILAARPNATDGHIIQPGSATLARMSGYTP